MHVASYLTGKSLSDIYAQAQEFAEREADREENPYPSYNKNQMTVRKDLIFSNQEKAEQWINDHDRGWYTDYAVRFYDNAPSSKKMLKIKEKINILFYNLHTSNDLNEFLTKRRNWFINDFRVQRKHWMNMNMHK